MAMRNLVMAAALGLSACGGGFCAQSAAFAEECGDAYVAQDEASCEAAVENCSAEDEKQLSRYLDCLKDSGMCDAASDDDAAWEASFACLGEVEGVSSECATMSF